MFPSKAPIFFAFLAGLFMAACSTRDAGLIDRLYIGMSKAQVVAVMGEPDHGVTSGSEENLIYYLYAAHDTLGKRGYVVQLVDGKVRSFGKMLTVIVPSSSESTGGSVPR